MGHAQKTFFKMMLVILLVLTQSVYSAMLLNSDPPSSSPSPSIVPTLTPYPPPTPGSAPSVTPSPNPGRSPSASPSPSPSSKGPSSPTPGSAPSPSPPSSIVPTLTPYPPPSSAAPPKSVPMRPSKAKKRAKDYKDLYHNFVLVGKKKYVLPEKYTQQGAFYYNYAPKPDDVVLISYPKAGNNWFSELLYQLVNKIPGDSVKGQPVTDRVPLLESPLVSDKEITQLPIDSITSPRVIRTQLPPSLIPNIIEKGKKIVYLARNPKDTIVSLYKSSQKESNFNSTIDKYFYYVKNSLTLYSPYWAHTKEGLDLQKNPNVFVVFAEESKVIPKVAKFLGANYTTEEMQKLVTYMGSVEEIELLSWPKVFSQDLNKAVNKWIKSNIGKITFPTIRDLYA